MADVATTDMGMDSPSLTPITLCLSGGGLRATLFHFGLIKAFWDHELGGVRALSLIEQIYSVSGGSITAAHMLQNWSAMSSYDRTALGLVERSMLEFAAFDIRNNVFRRWIATKWFSLGTFGRSRTGILQEYYERFLGDRRFYEYYANHAIQPPNVHIMATSFSTGELCSLSRDEFAIYRPTDGGLEVARCDGSHLRLSWATAASSAFPPAFPPLRLTPKDLGHPEGTDFATALSLSDGGVFDNIGIEGMLMRGGDVPPNGLLVVSNAGAAFKLKKGSHFRPALARNMRASDIMMRRIAEATEKSARERFAEGDYASVRLGVPVPGSHLTVESQQMLRAVRTDLDRFDGALAATLVDHGYQSAAEMLRGLGAKACDGLTPATAKRDPSAIEKAVRDAEGMDFRRLFFGLDDIKTWIIWAVAISVATASILSAAAALGNYQARIRAGAESRLKAALAGDIARIQQAYANRDFVRLEKLIGYASIAAERAERGTPTIPGSSPVSSAEAVEAAIERPIVNRATPVSYAQPVYFHFAGSFARKDMLALVESLRSSGWNMVDRNGGERTSIAAGANKVLFSGDDGEAAARLADALNRSGQAKGVVAERRAGVGPNLEVYVSN